MAIKKWTKQELSDLVDKYNSGIDTKQLSEEYNCSMHVIRTRLKENGITLRKYSNNREYKSKAIVPLDVWSS